jgi:hypothetical protein
VGHAAVSGYFLKGKIDILSSERVIKGKTRLAVSHAIPNMTNPVASA